VGGVFAEELKGLRSDRIAINVVYRSLRRVLELSLAALYKDVNELLFDYDILPIVEKDKSAFKRPPGSEPLRPNSDETPIYPAGGEPLALEPGQRSAGTYAGYPSVQAAPPPQMPVGGNYPSPNYDPSYAGGPHHGGEFNAIDPGASAYPPCVST
jgi:hypothetical protein